MHYWTRRGAAAPPGTTEPDPAPGPAPGSRSTPTAMDSPPGHPEPAPVSRLAGLVAALYKPGIPHAADLVAADAGRELVDVLHPPRPHTGTPDDAHARALDAHRMIVAAVAALGPPASAALAALLDLHPATRRGRRPLLNLTERREQAGAAYHVAGETIRRHHEGTLTLALAMELYRRLRAKDATTAATGQPRPLPPPPPPAHFQPSPPAPATGGRP